jgi:hypothetical protein
VVTQETEDNPVVAEDRLLRWNAAQPRPMKEDRLRALWDVGLVEPQEDGFQIVTEADRVEVVFVDLLAAILDRLGVEDPEARAKQAIHLLVNPAAPRKPRKK